MHGNADCLYIRHLILPDPFARNLLDWWSSARPAAIFQNPFNSLTFRFSRLTAELINSAKTFLEVSWITHSSGSWASGPQCAVLLARMKFHNSQTQRSVLFPPVNLGNHHFWLTARIF
jgi:hypothetical protein